MTCIKEFKFLFSNSKKFKLFNILGELKCLMPYCLCRRQSGTEELRRHRLRPDSVLDGAIPRGGGPRPETDQLMAEGKALLHGLIHSPRLWRAISGDAIAWLVLRLTICTVGRKSMLYFTQTHKIIRRKILYKFHFVLTRRDAIKKLESQSNWVFFGCFLSS